MPSSFLLHVVLLGLLHTTQITWRSFAPRFTMKQDIDALAGLCTDLYPDPVAHVALMATLRKMVHYSPMLVFQFVDAQGRTFQTQRYCCRGSVDDWIMIGKPGKLATLVKRYVRHLGQESYVELW